MSEREEEEVIDVCSEGGKEHKSERWNVQDKTKKEIHDKWDKNVPDRFKSVSVCVREEGLG